MKANISKLPIKSGISIPLISLNKFLTIFFICLSPSILFADERDRAIQAHTSGDYALAAQLWLPLANSGDPIAQYNIALLYRDGLGVREDQNVSQYWLMASARQGLADSYVQVNGQAFQVTKQRVRVAKAVLGPEEWVATQKPRNYTLQLASSTNKDLIVKYYEENDLTGVAGYYKSKREGEYWYALVYGSYSSVNEAKAAIATLPKDLKKWSPWVRNIKSIHKITIR